MAGTATHNSSGDWTTRPNVLWIGVDQMRADTLVNPTVHTPNLDRLRERSTLFTRAYSPSSLCTPSRGSMFTGRYAFAHGMGTNCDMYHSLAREMPDPSLFLHQRLLDAGYRVGYTGKWHIGTDLGPADYGFEGMSIPGYGDLRKEQGYRDFLASRGLDVGTVKDPIFANPREQTLMAGVLDMPADATPTAYLANESIRLLRDFAGTRRTNDTPFFLTCQFWAPHGPYLPSRDFAGTHDRNAIEPWSNWQDEYGGKPERFRRLVDSFYSALPATWEGWREVVGRAYDYTTELDSHVGRLLDQLDELGLWEHTIVCFESDHGDMLGSHGLFDKGYMYEEAHRIPMLFRFPDQLSASVNDDLVMNMDLFPTILDAVGSADDTLHGRSLRSSLPGADPTSGPLRDALYLEFHGIRYLRTERALVRRDGMKYIFNPADQDELYDLNADPHELHNLLTTDPDSVTAASMRRDLCEAARVYGDPVYPTISKWFGEWNTGVNQPDAASAYASNLEVDEG